jgi:hypothetical protein
MSLITRVCIPLSALKQIPKIDLLPFPPSAIPQNDFFRILSLRGMLRQAKK